MIYQSEKLPGILRYIIWTGSLALWSPSLKFEFLQLTAMDTFHFGLENLMVHQANICSLIKFPSSAEDV